jgi:putative membrane protein
MMWGYWGGTGGWLGPILMVLFWVLVIGGIVALVRSYGQARPEPDRAQEILRERYARGEISRWELDDLQQGLRVK